MAIRHLRASERLGLTAIRSRCQSMSSSKLESFVSQQALPAPLASALGMAHATQTITTASRAIERAQSEGDDELAQTPRWIRAELALGLELHVREDASAEVIALAHRVRKICAV